MFGQDLQSTFCKGSSTGSSTARTFSKKSTGARLAASFRKVRKELPILPEHMRSDQVIGKEGKQAAQGQFTFGELHL
jgi:hypothetical protein